ncbi:MAG: MFS transporter [Proteobacteria bacterium]|nr:MFS transporter [Pseudomonadota bacterium]
MSEPQEGSRNPFAAPLFTRWWIASLVAGTGVGIQSVSVPLFIRDRVDLEWRAIAISGALIAQTLPAALLALVGGVMADRVERRRILATTYSVAAGIALAYVALSFFDARVVWPVYILSALVGSAGAFTNPARQSLLPQIVSRTQLQNGVIFGTMGFMATLQFLGPTVGGLLVDQTGLTSAFAVETLLLATGGLVFAGIVTTAPSPTGRNIRQDLVEGLRYVRGEPTLRSLLILGAVPGIFFIGPFAVTLPILVPDVLSASDKWVGLLWGCFGGGVFLGSVALTLWPLPRRGLAVCASNLTGGLVLVAYSASDQLVWSASLLVAWGLGASVFMNYVVTLLQEHTQPAMMGRVMSMYSLVFFASMPLGYGQAGLLTTTLGIEPTLFYNGMVAACIGLAGLLWLKPVRSLP